MSEGKKARPGTIGWMDLTVKDAEAVRDFYREVVGWKVGAVDMGGYEDFTLSTPEGEETVAGVCHARGPNADLPPVWLIYINVENLERSLEQVRQRGGKVRGDIRSMGPMGRMCLIEDPAGAVSVLFEPAQGQS